MISTSLQTHSLSSSSLEGAQQQQGSVIDARANGTRQSSHTKQRAVASLVVGGPEDAKAIEEFDESPQWLVDDIMDYKGNNLAQGLKRMKRRIVVSEVKEETPKYKYAETSSDATMGADQFPDTLVNLRAELSRGKIDVTAAVEAIDLDCSMDELVGRTPEMSSAIRHLNHKAELLRQKHARMVAVSSSMTALPPQSQRYLERRHELMNSPNAESPLFRSSRTVPRERRYFDRSFSPNRRSRSPSPSPSPEKRQEDDARGRKSPKGRQSRSPSPARGRSPSRVGKHGPKDAARPGSRQRADDSATQEKEYTRKAVAVMVLGLNYLRNARAAVKADIDNKRFNTASFVISRCLRRYVQLRKPGLGMIIPAPIRKILVRYRRKKAVGRLRVFLSDSLKNQKGKAIRRFLYRIRQIQKCIRNWLSMNKARFILCGLYWDKIELAYRKRLAAEHQAAKKAQEELDKRIKKRRSAQLTADKWAKKKEAVTVLFRKLDKLKDNSEQLKKEEAAAASVDDSRSPSPPKSANGRGKKEEAVLYLGEFEGRISETKKADIIKQTVKNKIRLSMEKAAMDQLAAAEAAIQRLLNEDSAKSALLEPEAFKKLLQVQMMGAKKVQMKQKDGQGQMGSDRLGNWECFLLGTTLGPTMRKVIEVSVWNDILEKRAEAERLQLEEANQRKQRADAASGSVARPGMRLQRAPTMNFDVARSKAPATSASLASGRSADPSPRVTDGVGVASIAKTNADASTTPIINMSRGNSAARSAPTSPRVLAPIKSSGNILGTA